MTVQSFLRFFSSSDLVRATRRWGWWLSAVCLLVIAPVRASGDQRGSSVADALFELGTQYYEEGNYEEALHEFHKLLIDQPTHAGAVSCITVIEHLIRRKREAAIVEALKVAEARLLAHPQGGASASPVQAVVNGIQRSPPVDETSPLSPAEPQRRQAAGQHVPSPPRQAGEVRLFINGEAVSLERPILLQEGRPLIPLRELAERFYVSVVEVEPGRFRLIFPDGVAKEITLPSTGQEPRLTDRDIRELFVVETHFDEAQGAFQIRTASAPTFQVYAVPKSEEELRQEVTERELAQRATAPPAEGEEIPEAARPDLQLSGTVSYAYRDPHAASPNRSLVTSLTGRAFDFDVRGELARKDLGGVFRHNYSYLNFTNPDLVIGLFDQLTDLAPLRGQSQQFT
ncbi:MAG: hypothetical protein HYZ91_07195, partial [Candidatus Omnitrophica bacterium]|nr:hypothetical protein [Candidatus Omnitrophota bacterium]